ncbi:MAG: ion channel [Romboutsia sp.]
MGGAYKLQKYYNILIAMLALLVGVMIIIEFSVQLSLENEARFILINKVIWIVFCFDYFGRMILSKSKVEFVKDNIIDLLSIIPLDSAFKILKIFKITKLMKLTKFFKVMIVLSKFKCKMNKFLNTNKFNYVIYITITIILLGAIGISIVEEMTFSNALWWSFVTTTTVGYGDISPSSSLGRIMAVILMLVGIGFIGMLTGTIATFFLKKEEENRTYKQSVINDIKNKLDDFDSLTSEEIKDIYLVLDSLKERRNDKLL